MENIKEFVKNILCDTTDDILTSTGCILLWGEPEVPECLYEEYCEEKK